MRRLALALLAIVLFAQAAAAQTVAPLLTGDWQTATSGSITISTTSSPTLLVVFTGWNVTSGVAPAFASIADTAGLTWTHRGGTSGSVNGRSSAIDEEYAIANSNLTNDTITVHVSGSTNINNGEISVFAITQYVTGAPFDSSAQLPLGGVLASTTTTYPTLVTTGSSGDMFIGVGATTAAGSIIFSSGTPWAGAGFSFQSFKGFNNINGSPYWRGYMNAGGYAPSYTSTAMSEPATNNSGGTLDFIGLEDAIAGNPAVQGGGTFIPSFPQ